MNVTSTLPASSGRGFTLVEMLVSLAVTVSVVALMFAAWSAVGRSEARTERLMDRIDRQLTVNRWLGKRFDGLRAISRLNGAEVTNFFNGNPAGVLWVGPLPERAGAGGLFVFRISPVRRPTGSVDIGVEVLPFSGVNTLLEWSRADREILLSDVTVMKWSYQRPATGEWVQAWGGENRDFPARIRLDLADAEGPWPPQIFALAPSR